MSLNNDIEHMLQQGYVTIIYIHQMIFTHDRLVTIQSFGLKVLNVG